MKTYLAIDEFCQLVHLKREVVDGMIERGALNTKVDNDVIYIEANEGTMSVVPAGGSAVNGVDALYSTVQMPAGMPVATLAIGKAGAKNAAYLAMQILALSDENLALKLKEDREKQAKSLEMDSKKIEVLLGGAK